MPLYELFCIAAHNPNSPANLRQLIHSVARQVHGSGGVVRDLKALGAGLTLPNRMRRNQQYHDRGDHFTMTFDTSPIVINRLDTSLRADPTVIRWMLTKKGSTIKDLYPRAPSTIGDLRAGQEMGGV